MSSYLIFGGTGSLGKKLIERLLPRGNRVAVYSRDEAKHWTIRNELSTNQFASNLEFYVGDVRDASRVKNVIRQMKPAHIIIAAALKQVDTCELSPSESIRTNIVGTQNIIDAVNETNGTHIKAVLFVSTDKACSPVNTYGMCKAVSERIVSSQSRTGISSIRYLTVRYGNVLESRGSIIPLFKYQAEHSQFLTVTDPDMTRFVMTLDDSVDLINHVFSRGATGTTWIPRLPAMRIGDLAEIFAEKFDKKIKIIGLRPGEKRHEDLVNESESVRTQESKDSRHYVIMPAHETQCNNKFSYSSEDDVMSKEQLRDYLTKLGIIDKPLSQFVGRSIEEVITNRTDNRT